MRARAIDLVIVVLGVVSMIGMPVSAPAASPDRKAVEQALGKSGQLQAGDVFRVGMPRTDLNVTVKGVPVKPGFALGSYAAFKQEGDHTMVMGDLVLLDAEIPAVMSGLLGNGLEVTAVHNHLNEMSPHVMYMHYEGHGDAVQLAKGLRQALSASATPFGSAPAGGRGRPDARPRNHRAGARPPGPRRRGGASRSPFPAWKRSPRWGSHSCRPWVW
jgi:hypothetical protein